MVFEDHWIRLVVPLGSMWPFTPLLTFSGPLIGNSILKITVALLFIEIPNKSGKYGKETQSSAALASSARRREMSVRICASQSGRCCAPELVKQEIVILSWKRIGNEAIETGAAFSKLSTLHNIFCLKSTESLKIHQYLIPQISVFQRSFVLALSSILAPSHESDKRSLS